MTKTWKMAEAGRIVWMVRNELLDRSAISQSRELMEQVRQVRPEWVPVLLLEADIHRLDNSTGLAIAALERAFRIQPGNNNVVRQLTRYYEQTGQIDKAEQLMNQLPYAQRSDQDKRKQLRLLQQKGDFERAVKLLELVIPASSTNARDQIRRSEILAGAGELEKAEEAARKARELEPGAPEVWVTGLSCWPARKSRTKRRLSFRMLTSISLNSSSRSFLASVTGCWATTTWHRTASSMPCEAIRTIFR